MPGGEVAHSWRGAQCGPPLIASLTENGQEGVIIAPPEAKIRVTPKLGWPLRVLVDPRIGWPTVPRDTLDWPERATARSVPHRTTAATAPPAIEVPPGPRRARFDEDEFSAPAAEDDPPALATADRPTTKSLPTPSQTLFFWVPN